MTTITVVRSSPYFPKESGRCEVKTKLKTKLTSTDPCGWYLFRFTPLARHDEAGYWDGVNLLSYPGEEHEVITGCSNFRRLVEAVEPEVIEGRGQLVTKEQEGHYRWELNDSILTMTAGQRFEPNTRYMRIILQPFPPKKVGE